MTVRTELSMLGRVIRGGEERWRLDALDGATTALHGWALLSRAVTLLAVAGLAGWSAQRRR